MLKAIFDYDNPVMSFICRIIDLCVLSLLWLLCSLPVVTVGTATCSLYYAVIKSVRRQRSYPAREFLGCFRKNLKLSLLLWLLFLFFGAITFKVYLPLAAHFWFSSLWVDKILAVLLTVGIFFFASLLLWSFPILSRFDTGILKILELSLLQALRAPLTTVLCLIFTMAALFLIRLEPLLLSILPGLLVWLLTFLMEPKLTRIYQENLASKQGKAPEAASLDTWYLKD